jgi:hypothetical protein
MKMALRISGTTESNGRKTEDKDVALSKMLLRLKAQKKPYLLIILSLTFMLSAYKRRAESTSSLIYHYYLMTLKTIVFNKCLTRLSLQPQPLLPCANQPRYDSTSDHASHDNGSFNGADDDGWDLAVIEIHI